MRVVTVNGSKIKKINAIMYKDQYYSKQDDCVKIGGKYFPLTHPDVVMDNETKEYNLKGRMHYGIISFVGNEPVYGFFSENSAKNVICFISRGIKTMAISDKVLPKHYVECVYSGEFYSPESLSANDMKLVQTIRTTKSHTEKGYNIEDNKQEYKERQESYLADRTPIPKRIRRISKLLGNLTFGVENEVIVGTMPERINKSLGLVLCRDGSVDAGEYVSVPMAGAKGVNNIKRMGEEMSKRTITDNTCSYHVHLGNIGTNRVTLISLYKLIERIQDELFTMLPYYKSFYKGIKKKDYNKKLTTLFPTYKPNERVKTFKDYVKYSYYLLFRFGSSAEYLPSQRVNRKQQKHPVGGAKWNIAARYHCVNFINALFSSRNTIEFRCFQNTTNPHKMVSWLFICAAIVKYAQKNANSILTKDEPITLEQVMNIYKESDPCNKEAAFVSGYLNAYIEDRKAYFATLLEEGDRQGVKETQKDKDFTFLYQGRTLI